MLGKQSQSVKFTLPLHWDCLYVPGGYHLLSVVISSVLLSGEVHLVLTSSPQSLQLHPSCVGHQFLWLLGDWEKEWGTKRSCLIPVIDSDSWDMLLLLCIHSWGTEDTSVTHTTISTLLLLCHWHGGVRENSGVLTPSQSTLEKWHFFCSPISKIMQRGVFSFSLNLTTSDFRTNPRKRWAQVFLSGTRFWALFFPSDYLPFPQVQRIFSLEDRKNEFWSIRYFSNSFVSSLDLNLRCLKMGALGWLSH